MICAPGQGTIALESREEDKEIKKIVNSINHKKTSICVDIERSFLKRLEGGCTAPIGAYAQIVDDKVLLKGIISSLNGKKHITNQSLSEYTNLHKIGIEFANKMLLDGGDEILSEVRGNG